MFEISDSDDLLTSYAPVALHIDLANPFATDKKKFFD
jgi:hypothetical protein